MSLTPSVFQLKRDFRAVGEFSELVAQAEIGDVIILFDPDDKALQARCGSDKINVSHGNSFVALSASTQIEEQEHLWLYCYDGMLLSDLGVHTVGNFMPIGTRGVLSWNNHGQEDSPPWPAATITLIRTNGSEEVIFVGFFNHFETDSEGNLYILQDKSLLRISVTEHEVRREEYFQGHPMFLRQMPPLPRSAELEKLLGPASSEPEMRDLDVLISGNSLWIYDTGYDFLRVGPDGTVTTIPASLITNNVKHWYAQDEWLVILGEAEETFQVFKDGVAYVTLSVTHEPEHLIAVGPRGIVYGTNWDGGYSYFLMTFEGRDIPLTGYEESYFCVTVPEGVIMPPREESAWELSISHGLEVMFQQVLYKQESEVCMGHIMRFERRLERESRSLDKILAIARTGDEITLSDFDLDDEDVDPQDIYSAHGCFVVELKEGKLSPKSEEFLKGPVKLGEEYVWGDEEGRPYRKADLPSRFYLLSQDLGSAIDCGLHNNVPLVFPTPSGIFWCDRKGEGIFFSGSRDQVVPVYGQFLQSALRPPLEPIGGGHFLDTFLEEGGLFEAHIRIKKDVWQVDSLGTVYIKTPSGFTRIRTNDGVPTETVHILPELAKRKEFYDLEWGAYGDSLWIHHADGFVRIGPDGKENFIPLIIDFDRRWKREQKHQAWVARDGYLAVNVEGVVFVFKGEQRIVRLADFSGYQQFTLFQNEDCSIALRIEDMVRECGRLLALVATPPLFICTHTLMIAGSLTGQFVASTSAIGRRCLSSSESSFLSFY